MAVRLRAADRRHSRILGLGAYRPAREITNQEVCEWIDSSDEWIRTRCGIATRRFADASETLPVMAAAAGRAALEHAGLGAGDVDLVIVASMSDLVQTPPLAVSVAHALGAADAAAFDLSAACAGFPHALAVAADAVAAGSARHVLVVGAERMSDIVDRHDRGIGFMFADGAGAAVVGPSDEPGIGPVSRLADGDSLDALRMTTAWGDFRADPALPAPFMTMDGRRVFRWAVENVVPGGLRALELAGVRPGELGAFVPHQANLRMIELLVERLGLPPEVAVGRDVVDAGNTSAASIPLALHRLLREGAAAEGAPALLIGFGAGLNYAGQVVLLPSAPGEAVTR